jgi:YbbR domain-containing protein
MAWHPFRNFGLKAAALALGTLLWFTVSSDEVERLVHVPLDNRNLPAGFEITEQPESVEVRLRGSTTEIANLQDGQVSVVADLSGVGEGNQMVVLEPSDVRAPLGLVVAKVEPSTVTFRIEASATRDVPVVADLVGQVAPGYVVVDWLVEPPSVTVAGPQSRLRSTKEAVTVPVSVEGKTGTFEAQNVGVGVSDALVRLQQARTVQVTVRIEPASGEKTFTRRVIAFRNLLAGTQVEADPTVVDVTVHGRSATLADVPDSAINPFVDLAGVGQGLHEIPVNVDVPRDLTLVSVRPMTVSVRVR